MKTLDFSSRFLPVSSNFLFGKQTLKKVSASLYQAKQKATILWHFVALHKALSAALCSSSSSAPSVPIIYYLALNGPAKTAPEEGTTPPIPRVAPMRNIN